MPQLWIIAGPNGAGKTTLASQRLARRIEVVNPDAIADNLPRVDGRLDERRAGEAALRRREDLLARGADFTIETTLTGNSALHLLRTAQKAGYRVTLVYVGLASADLSIQRVLDRVRRGGHAVPVSALERRYPDSLAKLSQAIAKADRSYVFDNSGPKRRLLLIRDGGKTRYVADQIPEWARATLAAVPIETGRSA